MRLIPILAIFLGPLWIGSQARAADDPIDSLMYRDPLLAKPKVIYKLPHRLLALWTAALERPEASIKTQTAQAIAFAKKRRLAGLEVMIDPLIRELVRPNQHSDTRLAVTKALIILNAKKASAELAHAAQQDADLRPLVEPALARWDYQPARAIWLERLNQPRKERDTVLAINALAQVREEKAAAPLRQISMDRKTTPGLRLEAARALGTIRRAGGEDDAVELIRDASSRGKIDRLAAASILRHHKSDAAIRLLQFLARDSEPATAAVALAQLIELDPELIAPMLDHVLGSSDANVRMFGIDVLFQLPDDKRIQRLGDALKDVHPDVRSRARRALFQLARTAEWRSKVIDAGTRVLGDDDWRGLEQATILLAHLDHKPAAKRFVTTLRHDRPEVFISAAWGLRVLAVPETLQASLDFFDNEYQKMLKSGPSAARSPEHANAVDQQLSHLGQFFGQKRYRPADTLMRKLIPPAISQPSNPAGFEARAAAIWALGRIHEGDAVPELVRSMSGRLAAVNPIDVEDGRVRQMSAISLGRMKASGALPTLREFYFAKKPTDDAVNNACGWAIEQITGEKVPPPEDFSVNAIDWFLIPLK